MVAVRGLQTTTREGLLTWGALYSIVYAQQRDGSLECRLETSHFAYGRLQYASSNIVANFSIEKVEPVPQQCLLGITSWSILGGIVICSKLGDQICRVLGSVYSECLRNYQQCPSELRNCKLLSRSLR